MNSTVTYDQFLIRQNERSAATTRYLKVGVWSYFILLIFEGALRKWFLPFLATPLLVIRDPIAFWVIITALNRKLLSFNPYLTVIFIISIISFFATLVIGHGNTFVALFGLRILIIHFPFMFAVGSIFSIEDVEKIGIITLLIAIPMAILIGLQFYSPQDAWVNRGVGGDEAGGGFSGANGYFRPPGTFSFTNGNALFFGFVSPFVLYFLLNADKINRIVLIGSCIALIISIPLSISRTLAFEVAVSTIFMLVALSRKPQYAGKIIIGLIGVIFLFAIISQMAFFQTAAEAFLSRFTTANKAEGGFQGVFLDRYLGGMIGAITTSAQLPFFGYGMGMGTNVGSLLISGKVGFLISEGEWGRLIGEMGLLLGLFVILLRLSFCLQIIFQAYQQLIKNNIMPWMLLGFALLNIPQGQWAQPTSLGFSTLAGGLVLASLNKK